MSVGYLEKQFGQKGMFKRERPYPVGTVLKLDKVLKPQHDKFFYVKVSAKKGNVNDVYLLQGLCNPGSLVKVYQVEEFGDHNKYRLGLIDKEPYKKGDILRLEGIVKRLDEGSAVVKVRKKDNVLNNPDDVFIFSTPSRPEYFIGREVKIAVVTPVEGHYNYKLSAVEGRYNHKLRSLW